MRKSEQRRIFDGWTQAHRGLLLKIVRMYAFTPEDQDDLFQEIALQLWQSVAKRRGESAESTWIYRVALYTAFRWLRKERRHRTDHLSLDEVEPALRAIPEHHDDRLDWLYGRIAELHEADPVGPERLGRLAAGVGLLREEVLGGEGPQRAGGG